MSEQCSKIYCYPIKISIQSIKLRPTKCFGGFVLSITVCATPYQYHEIDLAIIFTIHQCITAYNFEILNISKLHSCVLLTICTTKSHKKEILPKPHRGNVSRIEDVIFVALYHDSSLSLSASIELIRGEDL